MPERLPARYRNNPRRCAGLGDLVRDPNCGFFTYTGLCVQDEEGNLVNPEFNTFDRRIDYSTWRRRTAGRDCE
jgi:hypothetical protein